jgi:hypothetical protein
MILRRTLGAGLCTTLVSLFSFGGSWGLPLVAAPFAAVEAPAAAFPPRQAGGNANNSPAESTAHVKAAHLERRDAAGGLRDAISSIESTAEPTWVGWTVPAVQSGERSIRHESSRERDDEYVLNEDGDFEHGSSTSYDTTALVVFARLQARRVDRLTFTDARCTVEAGRRTVYWLEHVRAADSVGLMAELVRPGGAAQTTDQLRRSALAVMALTDDVSADAELDRLVQPETPRELRRDAAFWLGAARGAHGAEVIDRLARTDRDDKFREHLTFVLTLTGPSGIERLIALARDDESVPVRRQALFWVAQKAGQRATATLSRAVDSDPDIEVRKHAVFAISQLPKDEAIPKLIELAERHHDGEVRKQAMFWLGQSGDPRALAFFEQVLKP